MYIQAWLTNSKNEDYIFSATDVFIHNTAMKKVKLIRLFILSLVLQNKHGGNMRFYKENFVILLLFKFFCYSNFTNEKIIMHHYYILYNS